MKLSKKSEYALRALVAMARQPAAIHSIPEISKDQDIPGKFLEQILLALRQAGLLTSRRGAGGGYRFSRAPSLIRVSDVIDTIAGDEKKAGGRRPHRSPARAVDRFLAEIETEIHTRLAAVTIEDLLKYESEAGSTHFEI